MYSGAYALIYGTFAKNIEIYQTDNGKKYGIAIIAVNKRPFGTKTTTKPITKTCYLPIHIWNEKLLAKSAILKKGKQVWIVGELEAEEKPLPTKVKSKPMHSIKMITVNVRQISNIKLLSKMPPHFDK